MTRFAWAFGLTFIFMVLWNVTPLGDWELGHLGKIGYLLASTPLAPVGRAIEKELGAPLIVWTEPITDIGFFFAAWAILKRRPSKQGATRL